MASQYLKSNRTGWLMAGPAVALITAFVIVPFIFAFALSFTNQRLISPNPTKFTGLTNYRQLLGMATLTLDPVADASGGVKLAADGTAEYPALRSFTRNNPDYPGLDGMREWTSFHWGESRIYLLVRDVVFISALINTFLFVLIVAPVQAGLALGLALLINQRLRGINVFRTIYFMPVVVSIVVVSLLWRFIYDGDSGLLNNLLSAASFGALPKIDWLGNPSSWARMACCAWFPWQRRHSDGPDQTFRYSQVFRLYPSDQGRRHRHCRWRVRGVCRTVGLRQVNAAADDCRA